MTPLAQWLKAARLSQVNPETGRPWSQDYLVQRVEAETGWRLHRENYNGYERGKGMQPETLAKLVDFWASHGVAAPDLTPPGQAEEPPTLEERAVIAAERQAAAAELQAAALAQIAAHLTGIGLPARRGEETTAWGLEALAALQQLRPARAAQ